MELKVFRPWHCSRFGKRERERERKREREREFEKCMEELDQSKMCQISMDGPFVNWKFFNTVTKKREEDKLPALINIGSYGLHVIHGA